jgi:hypothetical protein
MPKAAILARFGEKLDVLRIGPGPAALDVVDAEFVQPLGHAQFVLHAERNTRPLRAITQGRVVNGDFR